VPQLLLNDDEARAEHQIGAEIAQTIAARRNQGAASPPQTTHANL
jgi:hypothetical protein